jgi:hypothetical protein
VKRLPTIALVGASILLSFIVLRTAIGKKGHIAQPTERQLQGLQQITSSFAQIKTAPVSTKDFDHSARLRAAATLADISDDEREKLVDCVTRFYKCYTSGSFESFKEFRLRPPYTMSGGLAVAVKQIASKKKRASPQSDEDIMQLAWEQYNGTNQIAEICQESISLSVATRKDLGRDLRAPSGVPKVRGLGASCWEGAVVYQPSPNELLEKGGALRFFTLELTVRFNSNTTGPATPLVLLGYWDPTRKEWMPYALCTPYHVGSYDTIF